MKPKIEKTEYSEKTADTQEMLASSYVVTVDDYDSYKNPRLIDRNTFMQFAFKNGSFSETAQVNFDEYGTEFKTPQYPLEFLAGLLDINTYHEECVDRVSLDVSKHGWDILISDVDKTDAMLKQREEIIQWLNSMPIDISTTIQQACYDFEGVGVGAMELIRETNMLSPPQHLMHMNPVGCKLSTDGIRVKQENWTNHSWFLLYGVNQYRTDKISVNRNTGEIVPAGTLPPELEGHEIIWITKYKTSCNNYGSAKVSKAIHVIESEVGRSAFVNKFFTNYGMPAFAVTVTGNFSDYESKRYLADGTKNPDFDETKTLKYIIAQQLREVQLNPHSAIVITRPTKMGLGNDVKVEITPLSTDTKEASFRLLREDNKKEICAAHGMSSDLIGTTQVGNLGGTSLELDLSSYGKNKISPIQKIFNSKITPIIQEKYETVDFRFKLNEHEIEDKDKKLNRVLLLGRNGLATRREQLTMLAKDFNLNPNTDDEYLDEYLINNIPEEQLFNRYNSYGYYGGYNNYDNYSYSTKSDTKQLEEEILNEAYKLFYTNKHETGKSGNKNNGNEGIPRFTERIIRKHFENRK